MLEHLRQHERFTVSDQEVQQRIVAMHKGATVPPVTHYLAVIFAAQSRDQNDFPIDAAAFR